MTTGLAVDVWNRQCRMLESYANLVNEENRNLRSVAEAMTLGEQLAHIQLVRWEWLGKVDPDRQKGLHHCYRQVDGEWAPIDDLAEVKSQLGLSSAAVREAFVAGDEAGKAPFGPYDNPFLFLQHMVWHEGWHIGQISLALRVHGLDPGDEWEEKHVWELWRGPE